MERCLGACKRPYTRDFTPEVVAIPLDEPMFGLSNVRHGLVFMLHDTLECPDRVKWRMKSLQQAARALRSN
jgi:hypothetical protein